MILNTMSLPDIEIEYHKDYRIIFVNQIHGGFRTQYFEFDIISQVSNFEQALKTPQPNYSKQVLKRIIQTKLIIPPMDIKSWIIFLQKTLTDYEKVYGAIPSPEEIASKTGKKDNLQ